MHKMIVAVLSLTLSGWALAAEPAKHAAVKTKVQVAKVAVKAAPVAAAAAIALSPVADAKVQEAVAASVHTGHMVCELGNSVTVTPDPQQPSRFIVQMKKYTYHMTPVETTTGAVRLEDVQAGAMWLQLQNKSMLMNSKLGQRMADECQNDQQVTVAQAMKLNPPPSLLDSPTLAKK